MNRSLLIVGRLQLLEDDLSLLLHASCDRGGRLGVRNDDTEERDNLWWSAIES